MLPRQPLHNCHGMLGRAQPPTNLVASMGVVWPVSVVMPAALLARPNNQPVAVWSGGQTDGTARHKTKCGIRRRMGSARADIRFSEGEAIVSARTVRMKENSISFPSTHSSSDVALGEAIETHPTHPGCSLAGVRCDAGSSPSLTQQSTSGSVERRTDGRGSRAQDEVWHPEKNGQCVC